MSLISDILDATVEISTGSAELVATKWTAVVALVLGLVFLLLLVILLAFAPVAGLALAAVGLVALYILTREDSSLA